MGKKNLFLVIIFISVVLSGCVTTRMIRYENTIRTPKPPGFPIEIYNSRDLDASDYKIIGKVQANAGKLHNVNSTIEHLKEKAKLMGGDALMNLTNNPHQGRIITRTNYGYVSNSPREIWVAEVIVWIKKQQKGKSN